MENLWPRENMDKVLETDLNEYLTLFRVQAPAEPVCHYEEGELEARWLEAAGFSNLTRHFEEGREITVAEVETVLNGIPSRHAKAVKQRVTALNRTVRGRTRQRYKRKPDIRDVFKDIDDSSNGSRSRSATPDSLDLIHGNDNWDKSFELLETTASTSNIKQKLRRTPSAPLRDATELFRGNHVRCDIPFYTSEGIELLGFQKIGTLHIPRVRAGSEPSCSLRLKGGKIVASRSHDDLHTDIQLEEMFTNDVQLHDDSSESPKNAEKSTSENFSAESISFESFCEIDREKTMLQCTEEPCRDVNSINEMTFNKLKSVLWLELAALFDKHNVMLDKRKPFKRKRKEEGNLFGVSLNALVRRDQQITGEVSSLVPLFLQNILDELCRRGAKEEGILRVPGNKQKTEVLYNEVELIFYQNTKNVAQTFAESSVHDLSALLKRWLRELPQPLLANELIHLYYQTHEITTSDQYKALSILCLLLPEENRNTLRALLAFFNYIIEKQAWNKMTLHNVATIVAPSFFPPKFIHSVDANNIEAQVKMAALCYNLTKLLITLNESLFLVPQRFIEESQLLKGRQFKGRSKVFNVMNDIPARGSKTKSTISSNT